ncbi:hypothetical protein [Streptomyces sp. NPDC002088]|uniref:hypothetical protein n=1 Tax=unclassified Streptomyces TaxID=2593676 RepID=UPI003321B6B9
MGASGWDYITSYAGSVEESLHALHARVFEEDYGRDDTYESLEELWEDEEFMGEEGTHSILDIQRVVRTSAPPSEHDPKDYGTLRPLPDDRIALHFGTDRPTPAQFQDLLARAFEHAGAPHEQPRTLLDECRMRWTGVYVVLYTGDRPTHLGIFGYSGD